MTRCFCHVILSLPQEALEDDEHLARGSKTRELIDTLRQRHQADFGDLTDGEDVRYQVIADASLAPDQIGVRFGHAIYIPHPDEALQGRLSCSSDGMHWKALGPVYPGQRLIQLAGDAQQTSLTLPQWPFGQEQSILLINDGIQFQIRTKGKLSCTLDSDRHCYLLQLERQRWYVKYDASPTARAASVWKPRPPTTSEARMEPIADLPATMPNHGPARMPIHGPAHAPTRDMIPANPVRATAPSTTAKANPVQTRGMAPNLAITPWPEQAASGAEAATALPCYDNASADFTWVPVTRSRLSLVALALPRLDGYQQVGVRALEIGFNRQLQVCPASEALLSISVNRHNQIQLKNSQGQQSIALPSRFAPFHGEEIRIAPCHAALHERYAATISLPHPVSVAVTRGQQHLFGRGVPAFAALRVLAAPHFLQRHGRPHDQALNQTPAPATQAAEIGAANSPNSPNSPDQLGLSRRAFRFEVCPEGLRILREAPTQALFHLDAQCQLVASVEADAMPYLIPDGHHLVAGNYVLRFDA